MTERDAEIIIQIAREKFPGVSPRIISDNGPQFTARDFKEFVELCGMTHVRTSPYYPQSNGKTEATIKTIKVEDGKVTPGASHRTNVGRCRAGESVADVIATLGRPDTDDAAVHHRRTYPHDNPRCAAP